ncbi:MAG: DUF2357 domain-containing protein [Candidatus Sericytochromatia bacterium]|nr:DUF2357 domain-containing protein [Candidatus Sericytochromatia bacterium]
MLWETRSLEVSWEHDERGGPLTLEHEDPRIRSALQDASGRGQILAGSIDLESRVGFLDLDFHQGGRSLVRLRLEVFPSKLEFRRDFEQMLHELGSHRVGMIVRLLPPTSIARQLAHRTNLTLAERYQVFDAFFDPIERALEQIARQPHMDLARSVTPRPVDRLRRPDAVTRRAALRGGGRQVRVGVQLLPDRLPDGHRTSTFNTPANRFVARALRNLAGLLSQVRAQQGEPWNDPEFRTVVDGRLAAIRHWLGKDFLREATDGLHAPDLVVQRAPGYRDLLGSYRHTLLAFSTIAGDIRLGIKDLWYLYQIWCAVRVEQEATRLLGTGRGSLVPPVPHRPALDGTVSFPNGTILSAQHQAEPDAGGATHRPDLLIELHRPAPRGDYGTTFQLVLDAKYRLTWANGQAAPPQDAINAIHRYRDAILVREGQRVVRRVYGGAILFPHPDERAYEAHSDSAWHEFERMGVGAIPLVPGQGALLRRWLASLLHASDVRLDRLGPIYPALPPKRRSGTVLVAPLRHGEPQLEQMLGEGWYHLPTKWRLDSHRPTHLAAWEGGRTPIRHLWTVEGWERIEDDQIARDARFGGGKAGRQPPYWRISLGEVSILEPGMDGESWGPRGPMFVPLEVFDLAESTFLLHGDYRHIDLLRVLHHLREGIGTWTAGWHVREPLVLDGRILGTLEGTEAGFRWEVGAAEGRFQVAELVNQAISGVFQNLQMELDRQR